MNSPNRNPSKIRNENFVKLRRIRTALYKSSTVYLSQADLTSLGIKSSEMDLRSDNEHDSGPRFCTPFPADAIDQAFDKAFEDEAYTDVGQPEWPSYNPEYQKTYCSALELGVTMLEYLGSRVWEETLISSTKWDRRGKSTNILPFLLCHYNCDADEYQVVEILGILGRVQPHLACVLIDGAPADDRLRRSELRCAVDFMMRGMLLDRRDEFRVNPVFVYSFSNRDARILQAHFDGSDLIVRTSQYLNFEEENEEDLKLFLRWMMSEPTGPTRFAVEEGCPDAAKESNAAALASRSLRAPIATTAVVL